MKTRNKEFLISFLTGFVLPAVLIIGLTAERIFPHTEEDAVPVMQAEYWPIEIRTGGISFEMELEEYITGVVLAEMPASFETEALKAQAVVARTYARRTQQTGGKHGDGSICTDPGCCQAYLSAEDFLNRGGTETECGKIRDAVYATAGEILTYHGECIEATYFSCSGGRTEDAEEVWGTAYPYLTAKESPGEDSGGLAENKFFSARELELILDIRLDGPGENWFSNWQYTAGGGVASVTVGNRRFDGITLRRLLQLRSTLISVSVQEEGVVFHTEGYGHRVGMSQYGADALAVRGETYLEILQYYYTGTELKIMGGE